MPIKDSSEIADPVLREIFTRSHMLALKAMKLRDEYNDAVELFNKFHVLVDTDADFNGKRMALKTQIAALTKERDAYRDEVIAANKNLEDYRQTRWALETEQRLRQRLQKQLEGRKTYKELVDLRLRYKEACVARDKLRRRLTQLTKDVAEEK